MALDTLATPTHPDTATVEPSRAWILGLVVGSDGSVSGPGSESPLEWPSGDDAVEHAEDMPERTVV